MGSTAVGLQPKFVYGLRSNVRGNIHFLENQSIVYPVAGVIAIHDYKNFKQTFLRLAENHEPTVIAISPNRKLLAIAEWNVLTKICHINVYDMTTLKKKKSLKFPKEVPKKEAHFMRFSEDSRGLAVLSEEPDAFLTIFYFDKADTIIVGRVSNGNQAGLTANIIACNLSDSGLVGVAGQYTFKLMSRQDKSFGVIGTMSGEHKIITSLVWLTAEILVAGTSANQLLFIENGDPKQNFEANAVECIDLEKAKEFDSDQSHLKLNAIANATKQTEVNCLTNFGRGFCFAQHNRLFVFEKDNAYVRYKRRALIDIPIKLYDFDTYRIVNVSVNIQMDTVIATTLHSQIYISKLYEAETIDEQRLSFEMIGEPLHIDGIIGMSVCSWKPIIITAANDSTVRIWNYQTAKVELVKKYPYEITAIALHSTGLFVALGFSDQLHLMEILLDTLKTVKSFEFPNCNEVVFSYQGHLLACTYDNLITIFSVFPFQVQRTLVGHSGKVLSMAWSDDDKYLVSSGSEGAIYQWCVVTGQRVREFVEKGVEFRSLALTRDTAFYVCTNGGIFREIHNSEVIRTIKPNPDGLPLTKLTLSRSNLMLFVGSETGDLFNIQVPFMEAGGGTCTNYRFFDQAITCMQISFDDRLLVVASDDGTLVIWIITNSEDKCAPVDVQHGKCVDIIVPRQELIEMVSKIHGLKEKCDQQSNEFAFQLEHTRERQTVERRLLCDKYELVIAQLRMELQALQSEYSDEKQLMRVEMDRSDEEHSTQMIQLETRLCEKILNESNKSADLKARMDVMKEDYEQLLRKSSDCLQETTDTLTKRFRQQLAERETQIKHLMDEIQTKKEEFFHYCKHLNIDNERRIAQLSLKHETRLKDASDMLAKWRTDACILTKKNDASTVHCEQLQKDLAVLSDENGRNKKSVCQLEQNIVELQREIDSRTRTLDSKAVCLTQALDKVAAMEAMKQHLNGRAVELEAQIEPLNDQIKENLHEIAELKESQTKMLVKIDDLNVQIKGLNDKRKIVSNALKMEADKVHCLETLLNRLYGDIYEVTQFIQNPPKLKEMALGLYKTYVEGNVKLAAPPEDPPIAVGSKSKLAADRRKEWSRINLGENIATKKQDRLEQQQLIKENLFLLAEVDKLKAIISKSHINRIALRAQPKPSSFEAAKTEQ